MEKKPLNIINTFSDQRYFIPVYQRNYAWSKDEVEQLIKDVADYSKSEQGETDKQPYYIGNLVVMEHSSEESTIYETIDGQQRLTTFYIILCALKNNAEQKKELSADYSWFREDSLEFRSRNKSILSLKHIYSNQNLDDESCERNIIGVYKKIVSTIYNVCTKEVNVPVDIFVEYLLNWVKLLRIEVPEGIDKNHYFEVMNSRGVQLEQHEIVKALLMKELKTKDQYFAFDTIWQGCSYMEKYVQMNFTSEVRGMIFGDSWDDAPVSDFDRCESRFDEISSGLAEIEKTRTSKADDNAAPKTLSTLIRESESGRIYGIPGAGSDYGDDQFYSVCNFANFLLHVLKIMDPSCDVMLDDKKLSKVFSDRIKREKDPYSFSRRFIVTLLECRYLYDRYIVRRDANGWCLQCIRKYKNRNSFKADYVKTFPDDKSNELPLLLSMFHVSLPSMAHKNWLNAALYYVYRNPYTSSKDFILYLQTLAHSYMLDSYLTGKEKQVDFMDIIYKNDGRPQNSISDADFGLLNIWDQIPNFVFNYYDYLIYKEKKMPFTFYYRTSVEHFFPQHPSEQCAKLSNPDRYLNSFGNLALVPSETNSRFSNAIPFAKCKQFPDDINKSPKLMEMRDAAEKNNYDWLDKQIEEAEIKAIDRFKKELSNGYPD